MTNGEYLQAKAAQMGIPLRTLDQVKVALAQAKKAGTDDAMARLMLRHGRVTDEASLYIGDNYPSVCR